MNIKHIFISILILSSVLFAQSGERLAGSVRGVFQTNNYLIIQLTLSSANTTLSLKANDIVAVYLDCSATSPSFQCKSTDALAINSMNSAGPVYVFLSKTTTDPVISGGAYLMNTIFTYSPSAN